MQSYKLANDGGREGGEGFKQRCDSKSRTLNHYIYNLFFHRQRLFTSGSTSGSNWFRTQRKNDLGNYLWIAAAAAKSLQSCPTLCGPIDGSPPGSAVPGILQARTLEWVTISFSNAWKWKVKVKSLSCAWLLATPWTAAYQAPPFMAFSRQEYWSGLPLPSLFHRLQNLKCPYGLQNRITGVHF